MKRFYKQIFVSILLAGLFSSCVDFLDRVPDSEAFTDEDIFTDYTQSQRFIDQLLIPYLYFDDNDLLNDKDWGGMHGKRVYGLREHITDNIFHTSKTWHPSNAYRTGNFSNSTNEYWVEGSETRYTVIWKAIRVTNLSIANIDRISNATDDQRAKILGLAYFLRGHFYFMLLQGWGGMPYVTEPVDPEMNMDLPRETYTETARKIAADFQTAASYLPMIVPDEEWGRPSKMAAIAYKAKALVWGASVYANPTNDPKVWEEAAIAAGQAIDMAEKSGYYRLLDMENFKKLFVDCDQETLKEVLFGRLFSKTGAAPYYCGIPSEEFGKSWTMAESVTENLAQCFPWSNGEPITPTTDEYKYTPYTGDGVNHTGRDPRFYQSILYNGAATPQVTAKGRKVEIWNKAYDNSSSKELSVNAQGNAIAGHTYTGYYVWKLFASAYASGGRTYIMSNYLRLADLYLYYAEAANRAWGPTAAPQGITGFSLTAVDAINKVRNRAGMPEFNPASPHAWLKPGTVDEFEQKIRNEIRIETCFEEKRFYDLRRWHMMTDPKIATMYGMYIEKTGPENFTYNVVPVGFNLQWKEFHHLFKIKNSDTELGPNFEQNPGW